MKYTDQAIREAHEQMDLDHADDELAAMMQLKKEFASFAESLQRHFQTSGIENATAADVDSTLGAMEDHLNDLLIDKWHENIDKGSVRASSAIPSFCKPTQGRVVKPAEDDSRSILELAESIRDRLEYDSYLISDKSSMIGFEEWLAKRPVRTNPATSGAAS